MVITLLVVELLEMFTDANMMALYVHEVLLQLVYLGCGKGSHK